MERKLIVFFSKVLLMSEIVGFAKSSYVSLIERRASRLLFKGFSSSTSAFVKMIELKFSKVKPFLVSYPA